MTGLDQAMVAAYLAVTLWFGLRPGGGADRDSRAGYLLAGRSLTLPAFVATLVSTWYGGILGVGEYSFRHGVSNWLVFGVPYYLSAGLFALFLAGRARRSPAMTLPEQLRIAYGPGPGALAAGVVFLTTVPAAYLLTVGVLAGRVYGIPVWAGTALATVFSVAYVWRGGFRSVVRTDKLQVVLMFGGFALLVAILVGRHGFVPFLSERVPEGHWTWHGGRSAQAIAVWYAIALAALVEPAFYQRCFAAESPKVARAGLAVSIGCWAVFDALTTVSGLYARALLTDLPVERAAEAFPALAERVLPAGLLGLFFVGMLATVMSTADSYLFIAASTFGRDLAGEHRRWRDRVPAATRVGLVLAGAAALGVATLAGSVVKIWHGFGSVATATLLLPVLGAFIPALRMSPRGALVHMAAVLPVTALWLLGRRLVPGGGWPLGLEPIYAGLFLGAVIWLLDRPAARRQTGPGGSPAA